MANVKDLKKKIKSTKGTLKITSAMKLVSAAKLSKAQSSILNSRPYANELDETIKTIAALTENYKHPFLEESESTRGVILVISSNKGLCGSYNAQLNKKVRQFIAENPTTDFKLYFIGRKLRELLSKDYNFGEEYDFTGREPRFDDLKKIAEQLGFLFKAGEVGKVFVAYNQFNSAISFTPSVKQVLPMSFDLSQKEKLQETYPYDFKYDPSPKEILDAVIPEVFTSNVYVCLLDALAAEHGSRMAAMDNATSNCKKAIRRLSLKMNKLRQAMITTQLIEVVSGAESLKG